MNPNTAFFFIDVNVVSFTLVFILLILALEFMTMRYINSHLPYHTISYHKLGQYCFEHYFPVIVYVMFYENVKFYVEIHIVCVHYIQSVMCLLICLPLMAQYKSV